MTRAVLVLSGAGGPLAAHGTVHGGDALPSEETYRASLREAMMMGTAHEIVAIVADESGWWTALAAAGVVDPSDGLRLIQQIATTREAATPSADHGGQVLYPLTDLDWRPIPERAASVERALATAAGEAWLSVELGTYAIVGGTQAGLGRVADALPPVRLGAQAYPLRLDVGMPLQTPLAADVATAAETVVASMRFGTPTTNLIDGRGMRHAPWSADPAELAAYTGRSQLTETYRLATALRVALREYAPDRLLLPGPGASLAAIVGGIIAGEGYRGLRDRSALASVQASEEPLLMGPAR